MSTTMALINLSRFSEPLIAFYIFQFTLRKPLDPETEFIVHVLRFNRHWIRSRSILRFSLLSESEMNGGTISSLVTE